MPRSNNAMNFGDETLNSLNSQVHVVLLHNKFRKRTEDRYMVDMACALQEKGYRVTIYTSELDQKSCFDELHKTNGLLQVNYSGWWLPSRFKFLRAMLMAFRMLFLPSAASTIIIMDIHAIALYLLSCIRNYSLFYVTHFSSLHQVEMCSKIVKISPDMLTVLSLKKADEIIVQSECLAEVFRRSFPSIQKELRVLHPCVDTGLWKENSIDIERIVPDIPKPSFMFVCFGAYKHRSNFKIVLDAFEDLLQLCTDKIRNNIHLIIAGQCHESQIDQLIYYNELRDYTKNKSIASHVTFLKQLPTQHKKTLIDESIGVILPGKYEMFAETLLAVLAASRPVIAANSGFPREVLRHRISAILVEPTTQLFATAMYKVLTNANIQVFLSDMGHDLFMKNYSNDAFKRKINGIVRQYAEVPMPFTDKVQLKQD